MQVYDITARFSRTIQVREYEPASSELTIKAQLADGEKAEDAIKELFALASGEVHISLGLAKDTKLPPRGKAAATASTTVKPTPAADPSKTTAKPTEAEKAQLPKTERAVTSDIPGEGAPAAKTTAAAAASSDIPGETAPAATTAAAATVETGETTPAELSKWIGEQVRTGKVTSVAITGLYPQFGIARFADLKPEKCGEAKAAVQALIDKNA